MTTKRGWSASVPVKDMLLVIGGSDSKTTEYISPADGASRPGPDLPSPRRMHCAVKLATGNVMVLGGESNKKSAIIFNPDTETFDQSLPTLRYGRWRFGCATFNSPMHQNREVVLAVGGYGQATTEVLDYSQPNEAWTESNYA